MDRTIDGVSVHYVEHGSGPPLIALHGAGVDHRDLESGLENAITNTNCRRLYPDLPGMGRTSAHGLSSNEDVVSLLVSFIEDVSDQPAQLLGHSYGAYLARGVVARRPELIAGLALLCPVGGDSPRPEHVVVQQDTDAYTDLPVAQRDGFDEYFVVRTRATAKRYVDCVRPGTELVDQTALSAVFEHWAIELGETEFTAPSLLVAGRQDSTAGYLEAVTLLDRYPGATLGVLGGAVHALMHERPQALCTLVDDWLDRVRSVRR